MPKWIFDNFSSAHWEEKRQGNVDKTKSWVEVSDIEDECDLRLDVFQNQESVFQIVTSRDQWGTWITLTLGDSEVTIAQEDGTMSFVDSLIAALTELKDITDYQTLPPEKVD